MPRRAITTTVLVLCVLMLAITDAGRPSPSYAAVVLKPGDVLVLDDEITRVVDRSTGVVLLVSQDPHFRSPGFIAGGFNGEIYIADDTYAVDDFTRRASILRLDPTTGVPVILTSGGLSFFGGLAVQSDGRLLVVDRGNQRIVRVNPNDGSQMILSSGGRLLDPAGITIERDGSLLTTSLVSTGSSIGPRQIVRLRAPGYVQEIVSTGDKLVQPSQITTLRDGTIFVTDRGGNFSPPRVIRVDPNSGAQAYVSELPMYGDVYGIVTDRSDMILVSADEDDGSNLGVFRVNLSNGQRARLNQSRIDQPYALAVVQVASVAVCPTGPRPKIAVSSTKLGGGRLQVNVHADGDLNAIRSIQPGAVPNATVEGQPAITGADTTFVLRRTGPGAVTLPFTVTDACGDWKTFVGGGAGSF